VSLLWGKVYHFQFYSPFFRGTLLDPCPTNKVTEALESYVYRSFGCRTQVLVNTVISSVPKLGNVSVRVPEVDLVGAFHLSRNEFDQWLVAYKAFKLVPSVYSKAGMVVTIHGNALQIW
jgi:hypothetical protein